MIGFYPVGNAAIADDPPGPDRVTGRMVVSDLPDGAAVFLVELGTAPPLVVADPPSSWMLGATPVSSIPDPVASVTTPAPALLRYSDRGWIGEPGDINVPNVPYLPRVLTDPAIERNIRVVPEDSANLTFQSGELVLDNADGALNSVGGDWTMAGRPAVIRRGPHRKPLRAPYNAFGVVAALQITSAAMGTTKLTIGLRDSGVSLAVPVSAIYAGTGGIEGDSGLKGGSKPLLLGIKRNITPTKLLAANLVFQVSVAALASISGVRDRGSALAAGADYADTTALLAATVTGGSYATCLASGLIRTGSAPVGTLTCDATSAGDASHAGIVLALLRGPGGLTEDRLNAAAFTGSLPAGAAGFLFGSGTVADAMNAVLSSCAGWWGSDRLGRITGGTLANPDTAPPLVGITAAMLPAQPQEVAGTPPRWRQRVTFQQLATVQSASDLAGIASSNPTLAAYYTTANQTATSYSSTVQLAFPAAIDPAPLATGFDQATDAQALGDSLLALHGARRRRWQMSMGRWGNLFDLGDVISIDHPRLAGRNWVAIAKSETGDNITVTVWG